MGYVIDMIIVMSCLFALVNSRGLGQISPAMVNLVMKAYSRSKDKDNIHNSVRSYIDGIKLPALKPSLAIDRISELVLQVDQYKDLYETVITTYERNIESL
jgi:hypothetical protein